jgi:DNA polymerase I
VTLNRARVAGEKVRLIQLPPRSPRALAAWAAFTASDTVFGLDVETSAIDFDGLGPFDPHMTTRLVQFGNKDEAWVLEPSGPWRADIEALLSSSARFVSHNAAFDSTRILHEFGIDLAERSLDTLPMVCLLHPGRTAPHGLKPVCDAYIDDGLSVADQRLHAWFADRYFASRPRKTALLPANFEPGVSACRKPKTKGNKCEAPSDPASLCGYCTEHYLSRPLTGEGEAWGWNNVPLTEPAYLDYAGLDAIYVRRLLDALNSELRRLGMRRLSRTEQRVKRLMTDVSRRGHRVDLDWTAKVLADTERLVTDATERLQITTGLKPRSPHMRGWLTDHGAGRITSLDKDHLPDLLEKFGADEVLGPVIGDLVTVSQQSNLLSNLRTVWTHAQLDGGFAHPTINTLAAHTGRMSVQGPAMQTFAKQGEKGRLLRGCFIAREGHTLVGADYDGQEIRIAAALSGDPLLNKIVAEGLKQHVITAESIFGDRWRGKDETPELYHAAKTLNFAQQYGAGPKKIGQQLGIPYAEAHEMWTNWRKAYAGLVEWSEKLSREHWVRNPFGRLIPRDPWREFANGNYSIQSTGRDVLGAALIRLADAGWGDTLWMTIHDEVILEVPEDRAEAAIDALTECLTTTVKGILLPAEGELIGPRWAGLS